MKRSALRDLLSREYQATVYAISFVATPFLVLVAAFTVWGMLSGGTSPSVAYPMLGLCCTGLLGMGLLLAGNQNVPTLMGSLLAVFAAGIALVEAVSNRPLEEWIIPTYALFFVGLAIWVTLLAGAMRVLNVFDREGSWGRLLVGWVCVGALILAPIGSLIAAALVLVSGE